MIKRIKNLIKEFRMRNENLVKMNNELIYANIYHDTIRGHEWLDKLSISPGMWAGNYSFFYILVRILNDCKPKKIIEFGLGQSSKIISAFLENDLKESSHVILEENEKFKTNYISRNILSSRSRIMHLPIKLNTINDFQVRCYNDIENRVQDVFDLYVVDGPGGSKRYSRFDIVTIAQNIKVNDEFIIIMDDYERIGEQDTAESLIKYFKKKGIMTKQAVYSGKKSQMVIATEKYSFVTSLY